jgi:hypothetical protein
MIARVVDRIARVILILTLFGALGYFVHGLFQCIPLMVAEFVASSTKQKIITVSLTLFNAALIWTLYRFSKRVVVTR